MLFYTTDSKDFEEIPSGYFVFGISNSVRVNHPNFQYLESLIPQHNESKEEYKQRLKNNLTVLSLVKLLKDYGHNNSIVLLCSEKDKIKHGFNYVKIICKYINKKYNYNYYKFTNDVVRQMRDQSVLIDEYFDKFLYDYSNCIKNVGVNVN